MNKSKINRLLCAALAILVIAGCDAKEDEGVPGLLEVRFLHASPDAPLINIYVAGLIGDLDLTGIDYKEGSEFNGRTVVPVRFGGTIVQVSSVRPEGITLEKDLSDFAPDDEMNHEIILVGRIADSTLDALIISNPQTDVPAGKFRMQFVHASPDVADLIVYVTAPDAMLDASPSEGPIAFKSAIAPIEYPAGDYQIRVALASDPLNPIYDSGPRTLPAGFDFMVTVVTNTATGTAPISLIFEDDFSRSEILDFSAPAVLRFVNAMSDAPALDMLIDDVPVPEFTGLEFMDVSPYVDLDLEQVDAPESYNVMVVVSPAPGMGEVINEDRAVEFGSAITFMPTGLFADIPVVGFAIRDDTRPVATAAKLRVVNASTIAGTVNLYIATAGTAIGPESLVFITPNSFNLGFQTPSPYRSLAAGNYEITITEAGDPEAPIIDALPITVADGGIYTAVAIDTVGGIAPVQWLLMDDFIP